MKLYVTLSKKTLAVIIGVIIIALVVVGQYFSAESGKINGSTNAERILFLNSHGIEVDDSGVTSKEIVLPQKFSKVYNDYNAIQKKSGFDLSRFKGENATVYTYPISGDDTRQAHLIVCKGYIIGGDVAEIKLDGSISPIIK